MTLDLNALRAFVMVVDAGGITEGARRAGLPKSTVGRQVRDLEARLGEQLLERRGRGLAPTGAGRRLFESARGAVGTLEALRSDAFAPPVSGHVRVAATVMLARGPLRDAMTELLMRQPAISVQIDITDRFAAAEAPRADIALCVGITGLEKRGSVPLGSVEARLYAAPALLDAHGAPRQPADLARLPILAQGCDPAARACWSLANARGDFAQVAFTPRLVADDPDLLLAAAVSGLGVCRMPPFLAAPHLSAGRLVPVLETMVAERHEVRLLILRRARDAAVRCLAAGLAEALRPRLAPRAEGARDGPAGRVSPAASRSAPPAGAPSRRRGE